MKGLKKKIKYHLCEFLGNFNMYFLKGKNEYPLRVLILHSIDNKNKFINLLTHLKLNWDFISPSQFVKFKERKIKLNRPSLLLTFDDGFKNNLSLMSILDEFSISALFFVCPGLVDLNTSNLLYPLLAKNLFKISCEDQKHELLSWSDLRYIQSRGHAIGNHSSFHFQLNKLSLNDLESDIYLSKSLIRDNLGYDSYFDLFCYPFGGVEHINKKSLILLLDNFKYIFSGIRGDNNNINHNSRIIYRDSVSLDEPFKITDSLINGNFDMYYQIKSLKLNF